MKRIIKSKFVKGRFDVIREDGVIIDFFFDIRKLKRYARYHNADIEI